MNANLLANPLSNPLSAGVITLLAVVFGGSGMALLALELKKRFAFAGGQSAGTPRRVLWQRYRTWAIIAPVFAGAALSGPLTLALLCAFLCWQGGREYAALSRLTALHLYLMWLGGGLTLAAVLLSGPGALPLAPAFAFFAVALLSLLPVEGEREVGQRHTLAVATLWGYLYTGWLPAHLLALWFLAGPGPVLAVALGVALSDVGAFCAGKAIGGPKLAPQLSPNKTWGGVVGNLVGVSLALALVWFALPVLPWWQYPVLAGVIGLGSVVGDLLESLLKRQSGVKDAGGLLPGFGGLLDRIDSLLLVAPLVYYLFLVI